MGIIYRILTSKAPNDTQFSTDLQFSNVGALTMRTGLCRRCLGFPQFSRQKPECSGSGLVSLEGSEPVSYISGIMVDIQIRHYP